MSQNNMIKEAIKNCEDEKIHLIGSIQSHGYLLAVSKEDYCIRYVSENVKLLFSGVLLGKRIDVIDQQIDTSVTGSTLIELLNTQLRTENFDGYNPYHITLNGVPYNLITHISSDFIVLEFEPDSSETKGLEINSFLGDVLIHLNIANKSLRDILATTTIKLKELLGMDRVMIYQFDDDWSGEVVAEAKESHLETFLGLHFPATDIPRQARVLYVKNKTRHIANVFSEPVNILSDQNITLDQSFCQLRSVSPVHIQYLKNMGVSASFSISLICHGKLWGLVSCHNYSSKFIDYKTRKASEIISSYLSNMIELKTEKKLSSKRAENEQIVDTLDKQIREDWNLRTGLSGHQVNLLSIGKAQGAALCMQEEITTVGDTPQPKDILRIVEAFYESDINEDIFHTSSLAKIFPFAEELKELASGMMIIVISRELKECIIWFKPEQLESVSWAGKPDKVISQGDEGHYSLSPRTSFEKWENTVTSTSQNWRPYEIEAATLLKDKISAYLKLKANEMRRLNYKLTQAYEELNTFSYTLSHDLKTPLNNIHSYLELYVEEEEIDLEDSFYLNKALANTKLMQNMIKEVMNYAQTTQGEVEFKKVNIYDIIENIISQLTKDSNDCFIDNQLAKDTYVSGNSVMLFQIFLNLIENAVKYQNKNADCFVKIYNKQYEDKIEFYIEDNGVGIESQSIEHIFKLFKRANKDSSIKGSGVGLSIVKKLVSKHNGTLEVTSEVGNGSIFKVTFNK
ncbi:ATP-binding protein [Fulvivirga sediminis]|uniref:histidine kinase n=1 Tax=Fulvivirga sediminis TaxID=2803949 RepID=A0A937FA83_9BACT|nr:ATP-binding protein [Fulvivirga sediminis]MBL3657150.1 GAF domain-containing protein [Fulvivirga sediminis]